MYMYTYLVCMEHVLVAFLVVIQQAQECLLGASSNLHPKPDGEQPQQGAAIFIIAFGDQF